MSKFLNTVGKQTYKHKWTVLAVWLVLLGGIGFAASQLIKPMSSQIDIPGTQAQLALDRYKELFPNASTSSGQIVVQAQNGTKILDDKNVKTLQTLKSNLENIDGVGEVIMPSKEAQSLSENGTIAILTVGLSEQTPSEQLVKKATEIAQSARSDTLAVEVGGDLVNRMPGEILGVGEIVGVVLAVIVLVITLGSLIAAGMPILTALLAVGISMAGLFALSGVIDVNSTTPALAVMLGLAVGIDYSLFIINRYRTLLLEGYKKEEAIGRAIATAGNAVLFAALTVVIALAALSVVQIPFMTVMGLASAVTVAIAALISVTFIPALLGFAGDRILGKKTREKVRALQKKGVHHDEVVKKNSIWNKWGGAIVKHPIITLAGSLVVIIAIALPVTGLKLGLPTSEYAAPQSDEKKAYNIITEGFGAGANAPLLVVVEGLPKPTEETRAKVQESILTSQAATIAQQTEQFEQMAAAATSQEELVNVQRLAELTRTQGEKQLKEAVNAYTLRYELAKVAENIKKNQNVASVLPAYVTDDGTKGVIQVIPSAGPSDKATIDLIAALRDKETMKSITGSDAMTLAVTGTTAVQKDVEDKLSAALPLYLLTIVGLSLILLIIAFRSILVPLKATIGFLLSALAMFGAMVAVFQWGWFGITDAPGPIVSFIPIIATGVLFGLAMDYEFFLVSSMHEAHLRQKDAKKAVQRGFALSSRVVVAAASIMVFVFAGFITNHDATIQTIGFGLAIGVLVDAFIIRLLIVPAVMTLLGNAAWWIPKWLDRILPHVSIEGDVSKK